MVTQTSHTPSSVTDPATSSSRHHRAADRGDETHGRSGLDGFGPLGALPLFPRATLTDTHGYALPLLGLDDTGREVVFTVNGATV